MNRFPVAALDRSKNCSICGRLLSFHQQWAGDTCDSWRCRWAKLDREAKIHRQEAALALGEKQPDSYRALVVPYRAGSIENLSAKRRADHLEFIDELVIKVTQDGICGAKTCAEPEDSDIGPSTALAAAVCAVCAGACCHRAGNHAFLDTAAIERFIALNCQIGPSNIISTYSVYLPARSFAGSCVYHTVDGCALPRFLRADICNNYRCSGLKKVEYWARNNGTTHVYVVVRKDNAIKRGAFVQPDAIRHYPNRR